MSEAESKPKLAWRTVWQVPALLGAGALFAGGIAAVVMTAPKGDASPAFAKVSELVDGGQYVEAIGAINAELLPYRERGELSADQRRDYHLLLARALYGGQKSKGLRVASNFENIIGEYRAAEEAKAVLTSADIYAISDSLIGLGRLREGLDRSAALPESDRARRVELFRQAIGKALEGGAGERPLALDLLGTMLADAQLSTSDRVWATAKQARVLIDEGQYDDAIARILRAMPRLASAEPAALSELYLMLGDSYLKQGDFGSAERQFQRVEAALSESDELWPRVLVSRARIDESEQRFEDARGRYEQALSRTRGTPEQLAPLLGLGETEAILGETGRSLEAYSTLVDAIGSGGGRDGVDADRVTASLLARFEDADTAADRDSALAFAQLAERLHPEEQTPAEVMLAMARANRHLAETILSGGVRSGPGAGEESASDDESVSEEAATEEDGAVEPAEAMESGGHVDEGEQTEALPAATREERELTGQEREAQKHMLLAGRYFRRHANAMAPKDPVAYGESLWMAADSFDRSGNGEDAALAFQEYSATFPADPRAPEAKFRLARTHQARGDLDVAAKLFRELIDQRGASERGEGAGLYADASYVPLAQAYLMDANPDNDAQAEALLNEVISGRLGDAKNVNYGAALLELGRYFHRVGQYERAIERLEEAIEREPERGDLARVEYRLADSYRRSAAQLRDRLREAMPDSERRAMEQARLARLERARDLFAKAKEGFERMGAASLTELDSVQLRNAYLYLGDAAFDLGEFEASIRHYDAARERYPSDPATLVAMVQIVSAHLAQNDIRRAATANERARRFFDSLPPESWDDPDLPMSREGWERWLDATSKLAELTGGEGGQRAADAGRPEGP